MTYLREGDDMALDIDRLTDQCFTDPLWPEAVRIIRVTPLAAHFEVLAVGVASNQLHTRLLQADDVTRLIDNLGAQTTFMGDPELYMLGIEARRIQLGYTFDPFFAVSTSRIDPLPHQLEAVYGVLLKNPRIRFLLADDPGAGKTIMAGLLLKELTYRGLIERVLIVTPANLTDQWRRELKEKFGERFEVINRDTISALFDENPWNARKRVITSIDFAKQDSHRSALEHASWDLVIVDEAHKLSATRYGNDLKKSLRYRLGEVLSRTSHQLLFLTATPHQGDDEKFRMLLDLLEPDLFATRDLLEEASRHQENPILLRRLKESMTDFEDKPLFPERHVKTPAFRLTPSERDLYEKVTEYVTKHFKRAWSERKRNIGLTMTVLQRRLASSTHAIACSLEHRHKRLTTLRDEVSHLHDDPLWQLSDEDLEDMPEDERWKLEDALAERLTLADNLPELEQEIRELKALSETARLLARLEQDRKLGELQKILDNLPANEKLLIFTEHKDTLNYLVRILQKRGQSVVSIDGSMRLEERIAAEQQFKGDVRVMVATEAAGEGINLQFCSVMVNYDIPWNPTRLEQRMGRVHRYGQRYEVYIYNLVAQGTREGDVLGRLLQKLETMRAQLGSDRVYDVVGELLGDVNLEKLITDHLLGRKSLAEIQALVDARLSPERLAHIREITLESLAQRELDLSRLRDQKRDSTLHRLQPEYIARFFRRAFTRLGGTIEPRQDGLMRLRVPYELRQRREGVQSEYPRATFDAHTQDSAEFIAPGHPLFDAVLTRIAQDAVPALQQGASFLLPNVSGPGYVAHFELTVLDGTGTVIAKRLIACQETRDTAEVEARVLIDAEPAAPPAEPSDPEAIKARLRDWVHHECLERHFAAVSEARKKEVAIRRKYGLRSLQHLLRESTRKLTEFKVKQRSGDDMQLAILQETRRQQQLQERLVGLEKRLAQEESLHPEPAQLVALACFQPQDLRDAALEDDPAVRQRVELAAMAVALKHERERGVSPVDVSSHNIGYDIRSPDRAIEVKGRAGDGAVVLTFNEWITASRLQDEYYLYIVTHALTKPQLSIIQDPYSKLADLSAETVRYTIPAESWKAHAVSEEP
jgi:superfamily II DNA or RNA helicase